MKIQLLLSYFAIALSLVFCYLVGFGFNRLINRSSRQRTLFSVFNDILIGLVIVISAYSIVITSGKTISWIYLLVLGAYTYFYKQESTTDNSPVLSGKFIWKFIGGLFIVSLLLFVIHLSSLFDFKTLRYTDTNCDWQFYSQTAQYLNKGFESVGMFDNIALGSSFTPYHYFEIWIAAIFSKVFCVPTQIAINIIMPTLLGCISFVGILAFASKLTYKSILLAFILLFISCVSAFSYFLMKIGVDAHFVAGDYSSVVSIFKLYPYLLFFLLSLHYSVQHNFQQALVILLFIPVASFIAAPSVIPMIWLLIALLFLKRRVEYFRFLLVLIAYSLIFASYFFFIWDKQDTDSIIFYQGLTAHLHAFVKPLILITYLSPLWFCILMLNKKLQLNNHLKFILFLIYFSLLLISLLFAVLTTVNFDAIQFFSNIFIPSSTAIISLFLMKMRLPKRSYYDVIYVFIVAFLLTSMYFSIKRTYTQRYEKLERNFVHKVLDSVISDKSKYIYCGFINSRSFYSSNFSVANKLWRVGEVVDAYRNNFLQVCLSDYVGLSAIESGLNDSSFTKEQGMSCLTRNTFYRYVEFEKMKGDFLSIEKSQFKFIEKFKLKYIFIQNDAVISPRLLPKLQLISSENFNTGYSFYLIK